MFPVDCSLQRQRRPNETKSWWSFEQRAQTFSFSTVRADIGGATEANKAQRNDCVSRKRQEPVLSAASKMASCTTCYFKASKHHSAIFYRAVRTADSRLTLTHNVRFHRSGQENKQRQTFFFFFFTIEEPFKNWKSLQTLLCINPWKLRLDDWVSRHFLDFLQLFSLVVAPVKTCLGKDTFALSISKGTGKENTDILAENFK